MPKGACSPRVSRAVNAAMLEVSGKNCHSGLGGFAWEQGPDVVSFDGRRGGKIQRGAPSHVGVFGCLKEPTAAGLVGP